MSAFFMIIAIAAAIIAGVFAAQSTANMFDAKSAASATEMEAWKCSLGRESR